MSEQTINNPGSGPTVTPGVDRAAAEDPNPEYGVLAALGGGALLAIALRVLGNIGGGDSE